MTRKIAVFVALLAVGVAAGWGLRRPPPPFPGPPLSTPIAPMPPAASAEARRLPTLAPMLRAAMPAVVSVTVLASATAEGDPLSSDPRFRQYPGRGGSAERQVIGAGSGVIIDAARGLILTNNHLVRGAERIGVALADGRRFAARLIGTDPATDVALLAINAMGLVALPPGNSDTVEIGDYVVAIGNPFDLGETATFGIVSALGRSGLGIEGFEDFIQTDAAINPGNSGGALIDIQGRLIGINSAIIGPAGGNVGIGFAIPIAMARNVADQLLRYGKVTGGHLGVAVADHPAAMPVGQQAELPAGAMITTVAPGSPAGNAGLKPGDILLAVDGRMVVGADQLRALLHLLRPGTIAEIAYLHDGKHMAAKLRLAAAGK